MKTPKRYEFRTVEDFHALPASKIKHCVEDFLLWLLMVQYMRKEFPEGVVQHPDVFGWIDDGKHDANFRVHLVPEITGGSFEVVDETKGGQS